MPIDVGSLDDLWTRVEPVAREAAVQLVVIGGCSRTGKTTLARALASRYGTAGVASLVVGLDHWLIGIDQRQPASTVLERYDRTAIEAAVAALLRGETVHPPVYDPVSRRRVVEAGPDGIGLPSGVLIVEGVVALALPTLREAAAARIHVHVDDRVRVARLQAFYVGTKGLDARAAQAIIDARELEEVPLVKATAFHADMVFSPPSASPAQESQDTSGPCPT